MKLEQQVCSLELSQKLKELGVIQQSVWYWIPEMSPDASDGFNLTLRLPYKVSPKTSFSAFTVAELGEMLPKVIEDSTEPYHLRMWGGSTGKVVFYSVSYESWSGRQKCCQSGDTEADARAKMLIYLLENKLIKNF